LPSSPPPSAGPPSRAQTLLEIGLIFAVFVIQGAEPVPEVNEPYYLGKAIHYWNAEFAPGDFFLNTADSHVVFYVTFGWLSLLLPPFALAWVGRLLTWGLLAWAWRRLSFAVVPRRWFAILTAALWVCLIEWCHMAGEWVIGGVEAKGFAFVLVLLGLESLVRGRWNRVWIFFGAAAAFHVLVGGWAVAAAGLVWLVQPRAGKGTVPFSQSENWDSPPRPPLGKMWPALAAGLLLSLPGLVPALALNWGTDPEVVRRANLIYVFERLGHHLALSRIPPLYVARFALLTSLWLAFCAMMQSQREQSSRPRLRNGERRLHGFVAGAAVIALAGAAINLLELIDPARAASLLRFYWFRLADVAVPMGVALGGASYIAFELKRRPGVGRRWLALALAVVTVHLGNHFLERLSPRVPPADRGRVDYVAWRQACDFVAGHPGLFPPDARFLTPWQSQTFKWYTGRPEVANWKEIPQDAAAIVEWRRRIEDLYARPDRPANLPWHWSFAEQGAGRARRLGAEYEADYVITFSGPPLKLPLLFRNRRYAIYELR